MIGSLRGVVLERIKNSTVLIEVNGIGYLVCVTPRTCAELEPTTNVFVYIHHHVREDAQTLYGFLDRDERRCFEILIATHGVGPTLAMTVLATHSPGALVNIVASADVASLTLVPGVGKKTAERLFIELKSRLAVFVTTNSFDDSSKVGDVREALVGLGYSTSEIHEALRGVSQSDDTELMLRQALSLLGASRA